MQKRNIQVNEKFYLITHPDKTITVVRRDVYWATGWKSPWQLTKIKEIEQVLADEQK